MSSGTATAARCCARTPFFQHKRTTFTATAVACRRLEGLKPHARRYPSPNSCCLLEGRIPIPVAVAVAVIACWRPNSHLCCCCRRSLPWGPKHLQPRYPRRLLALALPSPPPRTAVVACRSSPCCHRSPVPLPPPRCFHRRRLAASSPCCRRHVIARPRCCSTCYHSPAASTDSLVGPETAAVCRRRFVHNVAKSGGARAALRSWGCAGIRASRGSSLLVGSRVFLVHLPFPLDSIEFPYK